MGKGKKLNNEKKKRKEKKRRKEKERKKRKKETTKNADINVLYLYNSLNSGRRL